MDEPMPEPEEENFISRSYQTQLEEIAVEKNTIIHLPTGSGKTYIAIRLINRFRHELKKPWGQGGKRTFFLVNTIPLVQQQKGVITKLCAVKNVAGYSGEDRVNYWEKSKWDQELTEHEVIVMTTQILADMLTHSYIKIEDINLLIFDECHHGVDDHPMRLVMKCFEGVPVEKQPRVLGLTATLLNANVTIGKVEESLRVLETTYHATIATVDEMGEVLNFSTNPREIALYYKSYIPTTAAVQAKKVLDNLYYLVHNVTLPQSAGDPNIKLEAWQRDISTDPRKIVKEVGKMVSTMSTLIEDFGAYGGSLSILAYIILLERLKRKAFSREEEKLYQNVITHSVYARVILEDSMKADEGYEKIVKHSSEKVLLLLNVFKEYGPKRDSPGALLKVNLSKEPLSAIIFTKLRFTAKILYNLLKNVIELNPTEFDFIKHDFIVGFNINPYKCTREQYFTRKASETALLKFSNRELNCLISTSVIEEGVDIRQCRLVLRYDLPLEYRSYVQSKGRARSSNSSYVMFINETDKDKFAKQYNAFQSTEIYIQRVLVGNTDDRSAPDQRKIQEDLYNEDEIPAYVCENGARLSSVQAVSLLNRYCSVLPHDQFTKISPMWIEEKVFQERSLPLRLIKIYMPIACPIKDVIAGEPMLNLKNAKRSAALNACIRLHKLGELDPETLLPRHYGSVDFEQQEVQECFPNWPFDEQDYKELGLSKPGTKKRTRKHPKVFPACLDGPKTSTTGMTKFYLHIIKLKTVFPEPKDPREKALYIFLQDGRGFGFLTAQALPKICDFPMFLTVGEVITTIQMNYAVINLDSKQLDEVKYFHYFLFDQVLEVAKKFTVFEGKTNCMYVVPIKPDEGYDIDWQVIIEHKDIRPLFEPTFEERKSLKVKEAEYKHYVVCPWYRIPIMPSRYIVSNVLEYMSPQTRFDSGSESFATYADYYLNRYNLEILGDKNQPMLEVRNISSRMNCLLPRAATMNAFSEKQKKLISLALGDDKPKGFPEIFIPEFCIKFEFPGVLWFKAMILPSIIHRVHMLLVAYELRAEIARDTNIGIAHLPQGVEWEPMTVNFPIAVNSLRSLVEEPNPTSNSIDRINNPIDETTPRPVKVVSMKESLYQLMKNKISQRYSWDEQMEPIDVERNISTVTVMDIECYDEFVTAYMPQSPAKSPVAPMPLNSNPVVSGAAAILPAPVPESSPIEILSRKPSHIGPQLRDILAALTLINSNDTMNLERAETLGDSFLKFAATLYLFHKFPMLNEGQLTNIKCRLIGNRNLYYAGERVNLGGRIKVEQFSPRKDFMVPGFFAPMEIQKIIEEKQIRPTCLIGMNFSMEEALTGVLSEESRDKVKEMCSGIDGCVENEPAGGAQAPMQCYMRAQAVSDKSVADCVEALVGTYLLSDGILGGVKILEWFKVLPPEDNFASYLTKPVPTVLKENKTTVDEIDRIMDYATEDVEQILNYKFKDPSLLLEALSHSSYIRNRLTRSYERLEFLGDAILDFLITSHIFENCPDLKPGELTDLRSALVNNVTFASYVVKLGLHKFICYQLNPTLENAIMNFIDHQERRDHAILEDVLYLIDEEDCHIADYIEVPKLLSDIFESLAGAIFLDSGGDLCAVWSVYCAIMCREIRAFSQRIPRQPVRVLHEMIHACPEFKKPVTFDTPIPKVMVPVTFTKNGQQHNVYGFGGNKFQAKRAAAKLALKLLSYDVCSS